MAGLEDLYREVIQDHYRYPRNKGTLEPPAMKTQGVNPSCGDEIDVYLLLDGTGDDAVIENISIGGQGCSISQSSASMMSAAVKGKTIAEARRLVKRFKVLMNIDVEEPSESPADDTAGPEGPVRDDLSDIKLGDLEALQGVMKFPVRIKCATLAWNTMARGFDEHVHQ
jgi:nitrogen fixation protein NifU and related proteins